MSVIDWSQAPNDATHYKPHASCNGYTWYRVGTNSIHRWLDNAWVESVFGGILSTWVPRLITPTPRIAAHEFLERGVSHMRDRAVQRDSEAGERSMARAVAAFNAQEGTNLTEAQGWRFMVQLKYARAVNGVFVADDYEDMAAYAGLAGEAAQ